MKYTITVQGCDDHTSVERELTTEQFEFLTSLAKDIDNEVTYGCMPTLVVSEVMSG